MIDKFSLMVSWGLVGSSLVYFAGLIIRSFPSLHPWVYFIALALAIIFGVLLSTRQREIVGSVLIVIFFGILGVILAGV